MAKILLPFEMPFDLAVTQYLGSSTSHRQGKAIDFAPIGLELSKKFDFIKYVAGYLRMLDFMRNGWLRINAYQGCWHYHYQDIPGVNYAGAEVYGKNKETGHCEQIYGTTILKINLGEYGSTKKLQDLAEGLINIYASPKVREYFTKDFWDIISFNLSGGDLRHSYVYYEESLISAAQVEGFIQKFSEETTNTLLTRILPGAHASQEEFFDDIKNLLMISAVVGGATLALNMYETAEKNSKSKRKNYR